jgi:adenylate kinase
MILVTGVSGVGKTFTIEAFIKQQPSFVRVSASNLLKDAGRRINAVDEEYLKQNQRLLLDIVKSKTLAVNEKLIFDGHAVLESTEGRLVEVPTSLVSAIIPRAIVTIFDDMSKLQQRREGKQVRKDADWTDYVQSTEVSRSRMWAELLQVPFHTVVSGQITAFAEIAT